MSGCVRFRKGGTAFSLFPFSECALAFGVIRVAAAVALPIHCACLLEVFVLALYPLGQGVLLDIPGNIGERRTSASSIAFLRNVLARKLVEEAGKLPQCRLGAHGRLFCR